MTSPTSLENKSGYSPISGAMDPQLSENPPVGALFSAGGKSGIVVYVFEKDRAEPWWLVRAMCEWVRTYQEDLQHPEPKVDDGIRHPRPHLFRHVQACDFHHIVSSDPFKQLVSIIRPSPSLHSVACAIYFHRKSHFGCSQDPVR